MVRMVKYMQNEILQFLAEHPSTAQKRDADTAQDESIHSLPHTEGDGGQKGRKSWRPVKATPRDTNRHSTALGQFSVYANLIAGLIPIQNRLPRACPTALNADANNATTFVGLDVHVRSIKDCAFAPATGKTERKSLGYAPARSLRG